MAAIKDYYHGRTHIIICDDSIVSEEEQKKILQRCGEIASRHYQEEARRKHETENKDKTAI